MATVGSSVISGGSSGGLQASTTVTLYNVAVPTKDVEVSQALNSNTKQFTIRVRGYARLQMAYIVTESGTKFLTIPAGNSRSVDGLDFSGTLFFQVSKDTQIVEIEEWT